MTRIYMFILLTIILLYSEFASAYDRGDKLLWACNGDESAGANEALVKAHCIGYVSGMLDASILIFGITGSRLFCPPDSGMSGDQQIRIVIKWLDNHPEELHESGRSAVLFAFADAFPCK